MGNITSPDLGIPDATFSIESLLLSTMESPLNTEFTARNQVTNATTDMSTSSGTVLSPTDTPAITSSVENQIRKVIECPVCYEPCKKPVLQCTNGHIVCNKCRIKINLCPLCKEHHSKSFRNLVAEEIGSLLLKLEPQPARSHPSPENADHCNNDIPTSSSGSTPDLLSNRSRSPASNSHQSDSSGSSSSFSSPRPHYNFRSRRPTQATRSPGRMYRPVPRLSTTNRTSAYTTRGSSRILSAPWSGGRPRASVFSARGASRTLGGSLSGRSRASMYNTRRGSRMSSERSRDSVYNTRRSRRILNSAWSRRSSGGSAFSNTGARRILDRSISPVNIHSSPMLLVFSDSELDVPVAPDVDMDVDGGAQGVICIENTCGFAPFYQSFNMDIEWSESDSDDSVLCL